MLLMKMVGYKRSFVTSDVDQWRTISSSYSIHLSLRIAFCSRSNAFLYKYQILFSLLTPAYSIVMMLLCLNLMIKNTKVAINPATIRKNNVLKNVFSS
jgi:hypothetical protein